MTSLQLSQLSKTFPNAERPAVNSVSLEVDDGEFVALVGPSGCGKSTTLRLIAGLEDPTGGAICLGSRDVTTMSPRERNVAMVFQNYALYPHLTVAKNIAYPLRMQKVPREGQREQVDQISKVLQVEELLERRPGQLSGGQRQRVAMARALVRRPDLFLLDEPLSNLDAQLRVHTRAEISRIQREIGITALYVTHDQVEAMTMADRVVVMYDGDVQQFAPPVELYERPANLFVAGFIGSPAMNILTAMLAADGDQPALIVGDHRLELSGDAAGLARHHASSGHDQVYIGIRPKDFLPNAADEPSFAVQVSLIEELGHEKIVYFSGLGEAVYSQAAIDADDDAANRDQLIRARFPAGTPFTVGDQVRIGVKVDAIHYFDRATQLCLERPS